MSNLTGKSVQRLQESRAVTGVQTPPPGKSQVAICFLRNTGTDLLREAIGHHMKYQSKKEGEDQESIQSSTTPDPGYQMGK